LRDDQKRSGEFLADMLLAVPRLTLLLQPCNSSHRLYLVVVCRAKPAAKQVATRWSAVSHAQGPCSPEVAAQIPTKASEVEAAAKLQHPWGRWRSCAEAGDVTEGSSAHRSVRVYQNRVIERIERLKANLESRFTIHVERAEHAGVETRAR